MDNAMKVIFGVLVGIAAIGGLLLASRGVDLGMEIFGLLLFAFGVFLDFWFIKRYFDEADQLSRQPPVT
jgi:hypothetical protein